MYLPNEFKITVWSKMRPYCHELLRREIQSAEDLEKWILDQNELTQVIQNEFDSRQKNHFIHHTEDERTAELYEYAVQELFPKITLFEKQLNEKLSTSKFASMISDDKSLIYLRKKISN
jgi:oligoendopeptidase F